MSSIDLRPAEPADADRIRELALVNGMFEPEEMGDFDEMLFGFFDGGLDGHRWVVAVDADSVVGAGYYAPEPFADRMWNLYFIATDPDRHGDGAGTALVEHVEQSLRSDGAGVARTLIVDTSSLDQYEASRRFYERRGFVEEARIRDFYGPGDHKVTFWKSLVE